MQRPARAWRAVATLIFVATIACGLPRRTDGIPTLVPAPSNAQLFAVGIVSKGDASCPSFTPDGRTLYFMREAVTGLQFTVMRSSYANGQWSTPVVAPFSGTYLDIDPFVTADGRRVVFGSRRPLRAEDTSRTGYQLWSVERRADGVGAPAPFGPPIVDGISRFFGTVASNGTLYFTQRGEREPADNNIYRSRLIGGRYQTPEPIDAVNTEQSDSNPFISPDEQMLIFFSARPGGLGGADLYVSLRAGDGWSAPRNLGPEVNTDSAENCPTLSPDGRYLFFARRHRGPSGQVDQRDIYYISSDILKRR